MDRSERVLVLGGSGQLGTALLSALRDGGRSCESPSRSALDLAAGDMRRVIDTFQPTAVINAAGYTDVARAERPEEREAVFALNQALPRRLARACAERGIALVHVSTDYVFDGRARAPYREEDPTGPLQVYGESKLAGELAVLEGCPEALVARTSTLFGVTSTGRKNYVDAVVAAARREGRLSVVRLPVASPTHARDLAQALLALLSRGARGLVHVVNSGACSRLELATEALALSGLGSVEIAEGEPAAEPPERPAYSALDTGRLEALLGRGMQGWREALRDYVETRRP